MNNNESHIKEIINNLDPTNYQYIITLAEALEKQQEIIANKLGMDSEELQHKLNNNTIPKKILRKRTFQKIAIVCLLSLTILLTAVFGAFALSGDFRHAVIEVFEDKSDSTRVSSVFAEGGTAHTAVFIDHIAINQVRRAQGDGFNFCQS